MVIVALTSGVAMAKGTMTIAGTVNDDYQIVADDGQVYEGGQNEKGDEVVDLAGKREGHRHGGRKRGPEDYQHHFL